MMDSSAACDVVRVHAAAGLALVRTGINTTRGPQKDGATRWIPWPPAAPSSSLHQKHPAADGAARQHDKVIHLHEVPTDNNDDDVHTTARPRPSLALQQGHFTDARVAFSVVARSDALPPQNVVVFLHGRGDSHEPFGRLGQQMALPQTAVISLRAPLVLPFDMGPTWIDDLDDDYNVIPPTVVHRKRSDSLQAAGEYVTSFLMTLRDRYHWRLDRVFLFGFSQGASVAFHVARTLRCRLGGVVLIAGGTVNGPHADLSKESKRDHETPALLVCGGRDDVFPLALAEQSEHEYAASFTNPKLFSRVVIPHKTHDMIRSPDEMRVVMAFFSTHLYLRNIALEARSDLIEITTQPPKQDQHS